SIMHANNEVGTLNPVGQIGALARERGIAFHCDAVQTFGKLSLNVQTLPVDLLTISAHKIYGPKGVGALYVRRGVSISPQLYGGSQEQHLRAGSENLPGIAG
ncbi:MAG: aminotransferase class V-fold PLP-dependent enzyme, partial [Calditrichaeota bacterium]|nr:aminotransferase class V-fold PLP-dependent enzyme [Calditrichota bacterium]